MSFVGKFKNIFGRPASSQTDQAPAPASEMTVHCYLSKPEGDDAPDWVNEGDGGFKIWSRPGYLPKPPESPKIFKEGYNGYSVGGDRVVTWFKLGDNTQERASSGEESRYLPKPLGF